MPEISQFTVPVTENGVTRNVTYDFKDSTARSSSADTSDFVRKTGNNTLSGLFEPTSDAGADLGRNAYRFNNIYGHFIYGEELNLDKPLSVANGGTGVSSIDDLKNALDIESFSTPTRVSEETIDTLSGTVVFDGVNAPFGQNYDWAGIQIGSSAGTDGDMFQLVTVNSSDKKLLFRKNDSGEWGDWERVCFYSELPVVDSSMSSTSTNPVQNKVIHTALGNKLDSSTVDSSGSSGTSGWYNCRLYNGKIQYYNTDTNTTYSTTSSVTSGSSALVTSGGVYSALQGTSVTVSSSYGTINRQGVKRLGNIVIGTCQLTLTVSASGKVDLITGLPSPSAVRDAIPFKKSNTFRTDDCWITTAGQYRVQIATGNALSSGDVLNFIFAYVI